MCDCDDDDDDDELLTTSAFPFQPIVEDMGAQPASEHACDFTFHALPLVRHNLGDPMAYTGQAINEGMAHVLPGTQTEQPHVPHFRGYGWDLSHRKDWWEPKEQVLKLTLRGRHLRKMEKEDLRGAMREDMLPERSTMNTTSGFKVLGG